MGLTPNAQLVINSRDRNVLTTQSGVAAYVAQDYSQFSIQKAGQNLIQGSIDKIQVAEINFPYDIPNVITGVTDSLYLSFSLIAAPVSVAVNPMVNGRTYTIITLGTVNWVALGAASAAVGVTFVYNGVAVTGVGGAVNGAPINITTPITIPQKFYTGAELGTAVNASIVTVLAAQTPAITGTDVPEFVWQENTGQYIWVGVGASDYAWSAYPTNPTVLPTGSVNVPKTLLSIMGFSAFSFGQAGTTPLFLVQCNGLVGLAGNVASLAYTQFIDICSSSLCGNTYIRDGSTIPPKSNFRPDLLCRVYIMNETSTVEYILDSTSPTPAQVRSVPGTKPFVIHRQFKNSKVIKSNLNNSLGSVDITLLDDCGNKLPFGKNASTFFYPRDFQITLNVHETEKDEGFRG